MSSLVNPDEGPSTSFRSETSLSKSLNDADMGDVIACVIGAAVAVNANGILTLVIVWVMVRDILRMLRCKLHNSFRTRASAFGC